MASPAEPRLPTATRATLPSETPRRILTRSVAWSGVAALVTALLSLGSSVDPAPVFACGLSAGLALAIPRPLAAALGTLGVIAAAVAADLLGLSPVLTAGATLGVITVALMQGPGWTTALQGAFSGALAAALGARLGLALPGLGLPALALSAAQGAIVGLCAAQVLWVASIVWISADRLPSVRVIEATLPAPLREPALRAHALDQALAAQTTEPETRDGLGEVAAWVYRLSWTQAALERELSNLDADRLQTRLVEAREAAAKAVDPLTREPREATVRHLEQLVQHRDAIGLEQERTGALIAYALAFLEQARAGLALARVRPGEGMPDRLGDVLSRLRSQTAEGDARRRTARQLTPLA